MTRPVLVLLLLTLTAAGCGESGDSSASSTNASTTPAVNAPGPVEKKREAIASAAQALDYDRLETLLDAKTFTYSFGETGDPIGYWRRLEEEAEVPILGDILPTVLSGPSARRGDIHVWPSVHGEPPSKWTAEERRWLRNLYSQEEIRQFEDAGGYLGYRAGIRKDGTWLFFVAGD